MSKKATQDESQVAPKVDTKFYVPDLGVVEAGSIDEVQGTVEVVEERSAREDGDGNI